MRSIEAGSHTWPWRAEHPWIHDALDLFFAKTEAVPPVRLQKVLRELERRSIASEPEGLSQQWLAAHRKAGGAGLQEANHGKEAVALAWGPARESSRPRAERQCGRVRLLHRTVYQEHYTHYKVKSMIQVRRPRLGL
jgi:hypothetical protein